MFPSPFNRFLCGALLLLSACVASPEAVKDVELAFTSSLPKPGVVPTPEPSVGCSADRYVQPKASVTKKVDLLFLTDTSSSLDDERLRVADGVDAFIQALPSDVDYRVAVMLAHGGASTHAGRLYSYSRTGAAKVLRSDLMSAADIRTNLRQDLTRVKTDNDTDGGEIELYSLTRSLDDDRLAEIRSQGFYREDAALAVVLISDENDICSDFPAGVVPVPDPQGGEASAKIKYCTRNAPAHVVNGVTVTPAYVEKITPRSTLTKLQDLQGGRPLVVSAIAYTNPATVPAGGENEYGYGLLDLVELANGVKVEMNDSSYTSGLNQIGALTTVKLSLQKEFPLSRREIDVSTLDARVDGQSVAFTYIPEMNQVSLSQLGTAESTIDVLYCEPRPAPSPTPSPTPSSTGVAGVDSLCQAGSFVPKSQMKVGITVDLSEGTGNDTRSAFAALGFPTTLYTDAEIVSGKPISDGVTVLLLTRKVAVSAVSTNYITGLRNYLASGGSLFSEYDGAALLFSTYTGLNVAYTGHFTPSASLFNGNVAGGGFLLPVSYSAAHVIDSTHPIMKDVPTVLETGPRLAFAVTDYPKEWLTPLATFSSSGLTGSVPAGVFPAMLAGRCGGGRVALLTMGHFQSISTYPGVATLVTNTMNWLIGNE